MVDVSPGEFSGSSSAPLTDTGAVAAPKGSGKFVSPSEFLHGTDKEAPSDADVSGSSALQSFGHHFIANLPGGEDIAAGIEAPFTGRSWSEQKKVFQQTGAKQWEEHPWASGLGVAGSVVGQVAALPVDAPEEILAQGVTRLAPAAAEYAPAIARTGVGAGYGAIYGGTGGEDLWDWGGAGTGALTGGAGGFAAPYVAKAVGAAGRYAGIGSGKYEGAQKIVKAFEADQPAATAGGVRPPPGTAGGALDRPDYMAAKAAGQPVQAVDLGGENVRELADEAQINSPAARQILKASADQRFASQQERAAKRVEDAFPGLDLNTAAQQDEIAQAARQQNSTAYNAAYNDPNAAAVWSPKLATLMRDPNMQAAIPAAQRNSASAAVDESLRTGNPVQFPKTPFVQDAHGNWDLPRDAQGNPTSIPNLRWWDQINRSLGDRVSSARNAGNMNDARVIGGIQNHLQDALDSQVPQFAQARASAAGFFGENKLVDSAIKFDKSNDENTINSLLQEVKGQPGGPGQRAIPARSAADQEVFARAYAAQLRQRIANQSSSTDLTNQLLKKTSIMKIRGALNTPSNPTRGDQFVNWLQREDRVDMTRSNYGNSKTAQRLAAQAKHGQGHGLVGQIAQSFAAPGSGAVIGGYGGWESTPEGASLPHTLWNVAKGAGMGAGLGFLAQRRGGLNERMWGHVARELGADNPNVYEDARRTAAETPRYIKMLRHMATVAPGMAYGARHGPFSQ